MKRREINEEAVSKITTGNIPQSFEYLHYLSAQIQLAYSSGNKQKHQKYRNERRMFKDALNKSYEYHSSNGRD